MFIFRVTSSPFLVREKKLYIDQFTDSGESKLISLPAKEVLFHPGGIIVGINE